MDVPYPTCLHLVMRLIAPSTAIKSISRLNLPCLFLSLWQVFHFSPLRQYRLIPTTTQFATPLTITHPAASPQWTSSSYSPTSIHYSPSSWNTVPQSNCIPCYCMPVKPLLPAVCIPIIPSLYPYPIAVNPCSPHYYNEKCTVCN